MDEAERLSALIGDIYDAALDPSLWVAALGKTRTFVGGSAAALYAKDAAAKSGNIYYDDGGIEPRYVQLYFDRYVRLDPTTVGHCFADIDEPVAAADIVSYDELLQTRFYKEWAKPQGWVDHVAVALEKAATRVALFGVFRHERDGVADFETRRRMRLIAPHVRRAVFVSRVIDLKTAEAATFADTLDGIGAGMFLLHSSGGIVHANVAGRAILAAGDVLRAVGSRLVASDPQFDRLLREALAAAASGEAAIGVKGIALPLTAGDRERYVAHVLPLTSGIRRRAGATYPAVAAMFVHKARLESPTPLEAIAKTYRLTPSELRVLLGVVEVGGVPEVAEALGVAAETVRSHLAHLYEKTGARRQADLVKLVAGFSTPLAG